MSQIRDAVLKEIVRFGPNEGHLSAEFFANVRSVCQEHASLEAKLAACEAILAELPSGAIETLKHWYAEKQRADKAEARVKELEGENNYKDLIREIVGEK